MGSMILMRRWCVVGAAALLVVQVGGGCGQETPPAGARETGGLSNDEVAAVAQSINASEIELGTVAVERATDGQVRRLAQRIVGQHTLAQTELGRLQAEFAIQPMNVPLVQQVQSEAARERDRLNAAATGGAFDRAFIDGQLQLLNSNLAVINNHLVQSATIPEYRQALEQLRDAVNNRFNETLQIRDSGAVPH